MAVDEAKVLASIRKERENIEWINASLPELRSQYGDRYVAVRDRRVIDSDRDIEALLARLRRAGDADGVTIEFVTAVEYVWVR